MIKKLYFYFYNSKPILFLRWLFWDYEPYAVTFEAYLNKLKKDKKSELKLNRLIKKAIKKGEIGIVELEWRGLPILKDNRKLKKDTNLK